MGKKILFKNTAEKKGRNVFQTPENSYLKYLSCARIILDNEVPKVEVETKKNEFGLIVINGEGVANIEGKTFNLKKFDALYLPPGTKYVLETETNLDVAECQSPAEKGDSVKFIPFDEIKNDPNFAVDAGDATYKRKVYKMIDVNVNAERLLAGVTIGEPGNWTSWTPHEHTESKEEVYLYIDMPAPAYGVQLVYDDEVDLAYRVQQDDAVAIHRGFHPNVGIPGCGIKFVWLMAAKRAIDDRDWRYMKFQEGL
ncbi:MAG: 5-deoxy-glucuronate isomerase [Candidatus Marinimicrobia bacterium]|nr:5-deoxy-glucuronate isomerase [Candidatus Neomarinimicrobiota bacterium]